MTIFAFLDIETTGLKPGHDKILEIAWRFTDGNFASLGMPRSFIVEQESWSDVWGLINADPIVEDMHRQSGLRQDLLSRPAWHIQEISEVFGRDAEEILERREEATVTLAGFSIHFDRSFLSVEPGWDDFFDTLIHYRALDLSAFKVMWPIVGLDVPHPLNIHPHRAAMDVDEALSFARAIQTDLSDNHLGV